MNEKISIRFFNDREVRAIWDEEKFQWWFSVLDIIAVLTDQDDYEKNRNYWKYLKSNLKKENNQVVSLTTQLKILAPDGKKRLKKCVDWSQIGKNDYMNAMVQSPHDSTEIKNFLKNALTDEIHSREMFMKGIDYSYYYEEE